ncbi:MAG: hypothetical protein ACLFQP_03085 [Halothece sp.]
MEAFSPVPPTWIENAVHALDFHCPRCGASAAEAQKVWLNRRAPVIGDNYERKWQEFYYCQCGEVWWGWSSDRPPSDLSENDRETE